MDVSYLKAHPLDCCIYPRIFRDEEAESKCKEKCQNSNKLTCGRVCYFTEIGALVDGKFVPEALKHMFENGNNDTEKPRESTKGQLDDEWNAVIDESIKACDKEYKHKTVIPEKKLVKFINLYQICLRMYNFLNCPDLVSSKECDEVKDLITTCDKNTRDTLFGAFHEPRRHLQKQGATAGHVGPGSGGEISKGGKRKRKD